MYIPYEIGDEVYTFMEGGSLNKGKITGFMIEKDGIFVSTDIMGNYTIGNRIPLHNIYPTKQVAKEKMLQRAVDYANQKLEDI